MISAGEKNPATAALQRKQLMPRAYYSGQHLKLNARRRVAGGVVQATRYLAFHNNGMIRTCHCQCDCSHNVGSCISRCCESELPVA